MARSTSASAAVTSIPSSGGASCGGTVEKLKRNPLTGGK
jgi:hypothetical protein